MSGVERKPLISTEVEAVAREKEANHQELVELVRDYSRDLSQRFTERLLQFNLDPEDFSDPPPERVDIPVPELPPGLTLAHIAAIERATGCTLEMRILPPVDSLFYGYKEIMYPETQHPADTARGFISVRPSHWNRSPGEVGKRLGGQYAQYKGETMETLYFFAIEQELMKKGGTLVLLDTQDNPDYRQSLFKNNSLAASGAAIGQLHKSVRGYLEEKSIVISDGMKDVLRRRIPEEFRNAGLQDIDLKLIEIGVPSAVILNQQFTFFRPAPQRTIDRSSRASQRDTAPWSAMSGDWSSTYLQVRSPRMRELSGGYSQWAMIVGTKEGGEYGQGAAGLHYDDPSYPGAVNRLSIRFKKPGEIGKR